MSELRTDFKDEILQEGEEHRIYSIKRKGTDEIVESDIYLEKAYTPLQEGNEFGAKEVNEIHGRLNGLAPQNLLINGDFQINQRGLGEYTSTGHTLDMWRCYLISGNKVSPISGGGIKIEKVGGTFSLRQKVPFTENDIGKKYTVSFELETDTLIESDLNFGQQTNIWNFEIGKKVYSHTFTLQSNDIVNGYVDLIIVNIDKAVGNINVYYCDLFEGDIAYPHVKEDYATALMRCQQYLRAGYYMGGCIFSYGDGRKLFSFCYENMKSTVTAKLNIDYYTDRGESHKTTNYSIDSILNGRITFTLNDTTANAIQNGPVRIYAELSCELL